MAATCRTGSSADSRPATADGGAGRLRKRPGAVPVQDAYRLRSANRATSPTSDRIRAAPAEPIPNRSISPDPRAGTATASSALVCFQLRIQRDQVGDLLRSHPASGPTGDVAGTDGAQHRLGLGGRQVAFALAGQEFAEQSLEPVDGLDPLVGQLVTAISQCLT